MKQSKFITIHNSHLATSARMSGGRFSRRLAVAVYSELLKEFGADITNQGEEQYSDFFEGTLKGKDFKFIVYHNKKGEFTKIDWQKVSRSDFQDMKAFFDEMIEKINEISKMVEATVLTCRMQKIKLEGKEGGARP